MDVMSRNAHQGARLEELDDSSDSDSASPVPAAHAVDPLHPGPNLKGDDGSGNSDDDSEDAALGDVLYEYDSDDSYDRGAEEDNEGEDDYPYDDVHAFPLVNSASLAKGLQYPR